MLLDPYEGLFDNPLAKFSYCCQCTEHYSKGGGLLVSQLLVPL